MGLDEDADKDEGVQRASPSQANSKAITELCVKRQLGGFSHWSVSLP